jgi:hypothetical protein
MNICDQDFILHYELKHPTLRRIPTFRYYDLPVMGISQDAHPFIKIDRYIDTTDFPSIHNELIQNIHFLNPHTKGLVVNGIVPKMHNNGFKSIDSILLNPHKYINFQYENDIKDLTTLSSVKSYFYQKFQIPEAWKGVCHLRAFTNYANKSLPSSWLEHAFHFPRLVKFVNSLPFKSLGYAVFFISNGNGKDAAFIHRDTFHKRHAKSHFINILFDQKPRPFFLYDALKMKKTYIPDDCCMYYFNESDLHGVDPENESRFMLRVEGVFTDEFAKRIGLFREADAYESFDWDYPYPKRFIKENGLNICQETDV